MKKDTYSRLIFLSPPRLCTHARTHARLHTHTHTHTHNTVKLILSYGLVTPSAEIQLFVRFQTKEKQKKMEENARLTETKTLNRDRDRKRQRERTYFPILLQY